MLRGYDTGVFGEGRNGFYAWVHKADADPPTHVTCTRTSSNAGSIPPTVPAS